MSGLAGSVPALPGNAVPVIVDVIADESMTGNGDIAITDTLGNFTLSNVDLYGNMGVDCAGEKVGQCINGISNSRFNATPMNPSNGVNEFVPLGGVLGELSDAAADINALDTDITLDFSLDGEWDADFLTIALPSGLTVFDFDTGGNDHTLTGVVSRTWSS